MLTGIGGGMARDVLLTEVPTVLREDLYAVAALAGAAVVVIADMLQLPLTAATASWRRKMRKTLGKMRGRGSKLRPYCRKQVIR
jgi:hypothetical protein